MIQIVQARLLWRLSFSRFPTRQRQWYSTEAVSPKRSNNLRILFFGSDAFSQYSLEGLISLRRRDESLINSIDVVCRTDKLIGRGRSIHSEVPIKAFANDHLLPIHQLDNFQTFELDKEIDLIVAVSFGLLIPAELIRRARYGGLNVHPSFLPDLRGAAPLHRTLLLGRPTAGVTVQTLHPTRFDHGILLAQTPLPGFPIRYHPDPAPTTVSNLVDTLGREGCRLLSHVIETEAFVEPVQPLQPLSKTQVAVITNGKGLAPARKMKNEDSRISWKNDTTDDVLKKLLVCGRVWDDELHGLFHSNHRGKDQVRVLYDELKEFRPEDASGVFSAWSSGTREKPEVGLPFIVDKTHGTRVAVRMKDDRLVQILSCIKAGGTIKSADRKYGNDLLVGWIENAKSKAKKRLKANV